MKQATPNTVSIGELVGSSTYNAIADDSLKDEDNAAWVLYLPRQVRREWIEIFSWIRLIDRMAENEWTEGWGSRFQIFKIGWRTLLLSGFVMPDDYHAELLGRMHRRWFRRAGQASDQPSVTAWDEYVEATSEYHRSDMVFETLHDYEYMLEHLGGSLFQIFSFLTDAQRRAVRLFGMVDQFFNHIRDLQEDTAQGLCYFPAEVLDRFGLDRQEILDGSCLRHPGYRPMMNFWLNDYLPNLYARAEDFLNQKNFHFSWVIQKHWFLRRHRRLIRALRACDMDFRFATAAYYAEVKPNLSRWLEESFAAAGCVELLKNDPREALLDLREARQSTSSKTPLPGHSSPGQTGHKRRDTRVDLLEKASEDAAAGVNPGDSGAGWLVLGSQRATGSS